MRERNPTRTEVVPRDPAKEASMETIANHLGISISTVSRALRDNRVISVATRRRVKEVARQFGYRPNPLIATLMTHIRDVNPIAPQAGIAFFHTCSERDCGGLRCGGQRAFEAARMEGQRSGYTMERFRLPVTPQGQESLFAMLRTKRIYGIVLSSCPTCISRNEGFSAYGAEFAMAVIGGSSEGHHLHGASPDYFSGMRLALTELGKLGYRRIGLALKTSTDEWTGGRYSGAFLQRSQTRLETERVPPLMSSVLTREAIRDWYFEYQPDAVLFADAEVPEFLAGCGVAGRTRAALASLNWSSDSGSDFGVWQNHDGVAAAAVNLVIGELLKNRRGSSAHPQATLIPPVWVQGDFANLGLKTQSEFPDAAASDDRRAVCAGTS